MVNISAKIQSIENDIEILTNQISNKSNKIKNLLKDKESLRQTKKELSEIDSKILILFGDLKTAKNDIHNAEKDKKNSSFFNQYKIDLRNIEKREFLLNELHAFIKEREEEIIKIIAFEESSDETSKLANEIIYARENGIIHSNLKNNLNKFKNIIDEALANSNSDVETKALNQLKNSVTQFLIEVTLETAEAIASPILGGKNIPKSLTAYDAFETGHEPGIAQLMVIDQIKRKGTTEVSLTNATAVGNSTATENLQKAIPFLFDNYEKTQLKIINTGAEAPGETYIELSNGSDKLLIKLEDWKNADLSKIQLTPEQLKKYELLLRNGQTSCIPQHHVKDFTFPENDYFESLAAAMDAFIFQQTEGNPHFKTWLQDSYKHISYPEKLAINIYSNSAGADMMNGAMKGFDTILSNPAKTKEGMLHALVLGQALPKLPDYENPFGDQFLWRGEGPGFEKFKSLDEVEKAVHGGGHLLPSYGFISSSFMRPSASFFNSKSPAGQFLALKGGKCIDPCSQYLGTEREILFPRGNFIYTSCWPVEQKGDLKYLFAGEFRAPDTQSADIQAKIEAQRPKATANTRTDTSSYLERERFQQEELQVISGKFSKDQSSSTKISSDPIASKVPDANIDVTSYLEQARLQQDELGIQPEKFTKEELHFIKTLFDSIASKPIDKLNTDDVNNLIALVRSNGDALIQLGYPLEQIYEVVRKVIDRTNRKLSNSYFNSSQQTHQQNIQMLENIIKSEPMRGVHAAIFIKKIFQRSQSILNNSIDQITAKDIEFFLLLNSELHRVEISGVDVNKVLLDSNLPYSLKTFYDACKKCKEREQRALNNSTLETTISRHLNNINMLDQYMLTLQKKIEG